MSEEQFRLACMELAMVGNNPRGSPAQRASVLAAWVGDSEIHLGCVRLAIQTHGNMARIGIDRVLEEATKYLDFVATPKMTSVPARKRGRPRK